MRIVALVFICFVVLSAAAVVATGALLPNCASCHHEKAFAKATAATPHGKVPCAACHAGSGLVARTSFAFEQVVHLAGPVVPMAAVDSAAVSDDRCLKCHGDIEDDVVSYNGLRIKHSACAKGATCLSCHSNTGHGSATHWPRVYNMDVCLHCHGQEPKLTKCDLCHKGRTQQDRLTSGPWAVTHGPNWRQTHGMGDSFTCPACHPKGFCDKCHGPGVPHSSDFKTTHPAVATAPGAKCTSCHKQSFCTDCHGGVQMPHPKSFIETHSTTVKTQGKTACARCHSDHDCTDCHLRHVHPGGSVVATGAKTGY
jgi:hypothetical protein